MTTIGLLTRIRHHHLKFCQFNRCLGTQTASGIVFNKNLRVKHLDRSSIDKEAHVYDYLKDHVAKDVCDRIEDLKHDGKRLIFNLGSCSGLIVKNLNPEKIDTLVQADISLESICRGKRLNSMLPPRFPIDYVNCDEESLPVKPDTADLVVSCLDLHWVNDLVSCFKQIYSILRDDSPFIAAVLGGDTLYELRSSLQLAELERLSGFSSHVSPKTTGQDIARLLQACGYKLITVDITDLKIRYPSMFELMFDIQGMGESNASIFGSKHMHKEVLQASAAIYQNLYGSENIEEGIPATFQIIHFIGWKNPTKATSLRSQ